MLKVKTIEDQSCIFLLHFTARNGTMVTNRISLSLLQAFVLSTGSEPLVS